MDTTRFQFLLDKYLSEDIQDSERDELFRLVNEPAHQEQLTHIVDGELLQRVFEMELDENTKNAIRKHFDAVLASPDSSSNHAVRNVSLLRHGWLRYAAAVLLIAGVTVALVISSGRNLPTVSDSKRHQTDIVPGTNRAVLTVDNKKIDLASGKTGITVGGTIAYNDGEKISDAGQLLTLATPNGGQYQLELPDGTKAWLNAASSIHFPATFKGGKRQIKVTGEVYLEVARNSNQPFMVDINGMSAIEVLGTSFNINSYADEGEVRTTLVEGSVKIDGKIILKPGQQAVMAVPGSSGRQPDNTTSVVVKSDADLSQALAWKNGLFSFNNADLHSVMKQLERWYDIKVVYEGKNSSIAVDGEMFRNVKLSDVLVFLKESGLKFRMEDRTLIVL